MLNEGIEFYNGDIKTGCISMLAESSKLTCLRHTMEVAQKATELSDAFKLDKIKLETAAYLHDISVIVPRSEYAGICYEYGIKTIAIEREIPVLLHQKISALMAKEIFKISDTEILSAIACHTTLKASPSDFDMALFIADKIMWDQGGSPPYLNDVEEALNASLGKACLTYIDYMLDNDLYLSPHPDVINARKYLKIPK